MILYVGILNASYMCGEIPSGAGEGGVAGEGGLLVNESFIPGVSPS